MRPAFFAGALDTIQDLHLGSILKLDQVGNIVDAFAVCECFIQG